jgi:hypothetical protein
MAHAFAIHFGDKTVRTHFPKADLSIVAHRAKAEASCRSANHSSLLRAKAGPGLCPRFRSRGEWGFPSENHEQSGLARHYFSLFAPAFTDSWQHYAIQELELLYFLYEAANAKASQFILINTNSAGPMWNIATAGSMQWFKKSSLRLN